MVKTKHWSEKAINQFEKISNAESLIFHYDCHASKQHLYGSVEVVTFTGKSTEISRVLKDLDEAIDAKNFEKGVLLQWKTFFFLLFNLAIHFLFFSYPHKISLTKWKKKKKFGNNFSMMYTDRHKFWYEGRWQLILWATKIEFIPSLVINTSMPTAYLPTADLFIHIEYFASFELSQFTNYNSDLFTKGTHEK